MHNLPSKDFISAITFCLVSPHKNALKNFMPGMIKVQHKLFDAQEEVMIVMEAAMEDQMNKKK